MSTSLEHNLEAQLVARLRDLKYEIRPDIRDRAALEKKLPREDSAAKMFPKGTILMALYGQGNTRGIVAMLGIEATTNQACAAILPSDHVDHTFAFMNLAGRYDEIRTLSNAGGQENLSQGLV